MFIYTHIDIPRDTHIPLGSLNFKVNKKQGEKHSTEKEMFGCIKSCLVIKQVRTAMSSGSALRSRRQSEQGESRSLARAAEGRAWRSSPCTSSGSEEGTASVSSAGRGAVPVRVIFVFPMGAFSLLNWIHRSFLVSLLAFKSCLESSKVPEQIIPSGIYFSVKTEGSIPVFPVWS